MLQAISEDRIGSFLSTWMPTKVLTILKIPFQYGYIYIYIYISFDLMIHGSPNWGDTSLEG